MGPGRPSRHRSQLARPCVPLPSAGGTCEGTAEVHVCLQCNEQERLERAWSDLLGQLVRATQQLSTRLAPDELATRMDLVKRLNALTSEARAAFYLHREEHGWVLC
jgi:hypothetical protein